MKKIKQMYKDFSGIMTLLYLVMNIKKLSKSQQSVLMSLFDDVKNERITLNQFTDEIKYIKRHIRKK